jgi:hypothetical protein
VNPADFFCDPAQILENILGKFSRNGEMTYAKFLSPFDVNQMRRGQLT